MYFLVLAVGCATFLVDAGRIQPSSQRSQRGTFARKRETASLPNSAEEVSSSFVETEQRYEDESLSRLPFKLSKVLVGLLLTTAGQADGYRLGPSNAMQFGRTGPQVSRMGPPVVWRPARYTPSVQMNLNDNIVDSSLPDWLGEKNQTSELSGVWKPDFKDAIDELGVLSGEIRASGFEDAVDELASHHKEMTSGEKANFYYEAMLKYGDAFFGEEVEWSLLDNPQMRDLVLDERFEEAAVIRDKLKNAELPSRETMLEFSNDLSKAFEYYSMSQQNPSGKLVPGAGGDHDENSEYKLNVGSAIDSLNTDIPNILRIQPNWEIYSENLELDLQGADAVALRLIGGVAGLPGRKAKGLQANQQALHRLQRFRNFWVQRDVVRIKTRAGMHSLSRSKDDDEVVEVRWNAKLFMKPDIDLIPKWASTNIKLLRKHVFGFPANEDHPQREFTIDAVSRFYFNSEGKIYRHVVTDLELLPTLDMLQVDDILWMIGVNSQGPALAH